MMLFFSVFLTNNATFFLFDHSKGPIENSFDLFLLGYFLQTLINGLYLLIFILYIFFIDNTRDLLKATVCYDKEWGLYSQLIQK